MLISLCLIFGCSSQPSRYLALGDSYTIGESVDSGERWPVQLVKLLRTNGYPFEDPLIIAKTGWTTDELSDGIKEFNQESKFDLVTLLIGVNNQFRGRDIEEFRNQFRDLLSQAIKFADGKPDRVFVLSIPDWGVSPFAEGRNRDEIGQEIDQFNSVIKKETLESGVIYLDITAISREAANDSTLIAIDGLHPSAKMYAEWVKILLPEVEKYLEK